MKNLILKNKYLFLSALFLLTVAMSVSASFTIAKYTKTVDVGTIWLDFSKEAPMEQSAELSDSSYTVQTGDTLSKIAERYSTTVEKLQAYNDIEGIQITVGQKINIPPQDYVIPESEPIVPQETTPAETEPSPTEPSPTEPSPTEPSPTEPPHTDSSNTPVTDASTLPKEPTDESVFVNTDDPAISE